MWLAVRVCNAILTSIRASLLAEARACIFPMRPVRIVNLTAFCSNRTYCNRTGPESCSPGISLQ